MNETYFDELPRELLELFVEYIDLENIDNYIDLFSPIMQYFLYIVKRNRYKKLFKKEFEGLYELFVRFDDDYRPNNLWQISYEKMIGLLPLLNRNILNSKNIINYMTIDELPKILYEIFSYNEDKNLYEQIIFKIDSYDYITSIDDSTWEYLYTIFLIINNEGHSDLLDKELLKKFVKEFVDVLGNDSNGHIILRSLLENDEIKELFSIYLSNELLDNLIIKKSKKTYKSKKKVLKILLSYLYDVVGAGYMRYYFERCINLDDKKMMCWLVNLYKEKYTGEYDEDEELINDFKFQGYKIK